METWIKLTDINKEAFRHLGEPKIQQAIAGLLSFGIAYSGYDIFLERFGLYEYKIGFQQKTSNTRHTIIVMDGIGEEHDFLLAKGMYRHPAFYLMSLTEIYEAQKKGEQIKFPKPLAPGLDLDFLKVKIGETARETSQSFQALFPALKGFKRRNFKLENRGTRTTKLLKILKKALDKETEFDWSIDNSRLISSRYSYYVIVDTGFIFTAKYRQVIGRYLTIRSLIKDVKRDLKVIRSKGSPSKWRV